MMTDTLSPNMQVSSLDELDGLPIDAETMFVDHKAAYKPRIEKKQRILAKKVSFLKEILEEGERLLVITTAVSPTSFFEQWTTGFIFVYIKRCLLVMTDRRIFHIPTTMNYKYRRSIAQIRYSDIDSITQKGSKLKILYKNGAKDLFLYVRRAERKKIRALLPSLEYQGSTSIAGKRAHLCPRCSSELETDVYECSSCGLEFKSRKKALTLSIWLPGGGYFYTGHPLLGIGDALFELLLILAIAGSLIPDADFPEGDPGAALSFGVILIIEKLITIYHANHFVKEFLTKDKEIKPDGQFV
jgi:hypothetical protein